MRMNKKKIIVITGPTASGKSKLGFDLAKKLNTQIISVDSRLVYRNFEIAAAKPNKDMIAQINHHLVNFVDPHYQYTAGDFVFHSRNIIENIHNQGKIPILVGGTYLYYKVLLDDYDLPKCNINYEYRDYLNTKSDLQLYDMLLNADFKTAQKIHVNNRVKIIRSLELIREFGMKLDDILKEHKDDNDKSQFDILWFGLKVNNREILYNLINQRVDNMMDKGLLKETTANYKRYENLPNFVNTIGYCELIDYINNKTTLNEAIDKIKQHTRNYAKRQLSFMNTNKNIKWFNIDEMDFDNIFQSIFNIVID